MNDQTITQRLVRDPTLLRVTDTVADAVGLIEESDLPALPVVDGEERYAGIFGEREFMAALFPGYLSQLKHTAFLTQSLDDVLERRDACRAEPVARYMNTEHVDVGPDFSDTHVAEIFLHHRVLLIPVTRERRVIGIITRRDFFRAVARRFLAA